MPTPSQLHLERDLDLSERRIREARRGPDRDPYGDAPTAIRTGPSILTQVVSVIIVVGAGLSSVLTLTHLVLGALR